MCGIAGFITDGRGKAKDAARAFTELMLLSESRGKEAAGAIFASNDRVRIVKSPTSASELVRHRDFTKSMDYAIRASEQGAGGPNHFLAIGHSRLVTNGSQLVPSNNQPVVKDGLVGVHNGIIVNVEALWSKRPELRRECEVDTEVFLAYAAQSVNSGQQSLSSAVRSAFEEIKGATSVAVLTVDRNELVIATNNGSLYWWESLDKGACAFASERAFLDKLCRRRWFRRAWGDGLVSRVAPQSGVKLGHGGGANPFNFADAEDARTVTDNITPRHRDISVLNTLCTASSESGRATAADPSIAKQLVVDEYQRSREAIARLRRCTRCVLPETMPFIEFDEQGICNFCRYYVPLQHLGIEALQEAVAPFRLRTDRPDCLVTFSGGRDSSYGLHLVKNVLNLNPVAYTYDWGMVTDLARRNQMRLCGKLGIEHILVSADINRKRRNIRKNVSAWLRRPDLGTVPLFMAGDKQYFYYANKIAKENKCRLIILCENLFETTRFKSGFCGVPPRHGSRHTYTLSVVDQAKMLSYYTRAALRNPGYLNGSLADTLWAFACYYAIPHPYLNVFEYIRWDEQQIDDVLVREYEWETAVDTRTTWRIGDGTAPFYNYIYYTMAGFSENDTFRSNQVREGMLTRDAALVLVNRDNEPRYESMRWYCDTIGIDFAAAMRAIHEAPKRIRG